MAMRCIAKRARRCPKAYRRARRQQILSAGPPIGKPPFGSRMRSVGGRRNGLTMPRIAGAAPPTRRAAYAISRGHYQRSLV